MSARQPPGFAPFPSLDPSPHLPFGQVRGSAFDMIEVQTIIGNGAAAGANNNPLSETEQGTR